MLKLNVGNTESIEQIGSAHLKCSIENWINNIAIANLHLVT